jgi:hypothetical protein
MSFLYNVAKQAFLGGTPSLDLLNGRIGVGLLRNTYSGTNAETSLATHATLGAIGTTNIVATAWLNAATNATASISSGSTFSIANGILDGPDVIVQSVAGDTSVTINAVLLFEHTAQGVTALNTSATGALPIAYINQVSSGLNIVGPSGANVTVVWDNGDNKIFAL